MTQKNHIYLASTLTLLSLSTSLYLNSKNVQADTNQVQTEQVNSNANLGANSASTQSQSASSASAFATSSNNVASENTTEPTQSLSINSQNSAAPATAYTTVKAAAQTAYDGTPVINIGDANYPRVDAVDISGYQASMTANNFVTLKNLGVKTAIVKVTEGTYYINRYAGQQINYAKNAGLNVQVYHYAKFGSQGAAINEANYLANEMEALGLDKNTLIYADMEDTTTKYYGVANHLNAFWNQLNNRGFTNHAVYASTSYDQTYNVSSTVGKNRTWIAQYLYSPSSTNLRNQNYGAWQFNAHGRIPGYNGDLDISIDYQGLVANSGEWSNNNGKWSYSINGNNVTGWQRINNNWYYFNQDGTAQTGWYQSGAGNWYYFDYTNAWALTGWQYINNNWYYFDYSNAWADKGWQFINNNWYYFDPMNAWALRGWQTINGNRYYLDPSNVWALKGFQYLDNAWYYFDDSNAWLSHGWRYNGGQWYYLSPSTGQLESGLQTVNGKVYYLQPNHNGYFGAMQTGWFNLSNHWYFFNNGGDAATGWFKSPAGAWYYFDVNGQARTGWQTINGNRYYFDPSNAWADTNWQYINNNWYYFDNDGKAETGWQIINGHRYYLDNDGKAVTGYQYIDGKLYHFDQENAWLLAD